MKCELSKKPKYKKLWLLFLMLFFTLSLTACQKKSKSQVAETEEQEVFYNIYETVLPNPDNVLSEYLSEDSWIQEDDVIIQGSKIYRNVSVLHPSEQAKSFLQIINPSYTEWSTYDVLSMFWNEKETPYRAYIDRILIIDDKYLYTFISARMNEEDELKCYVGIWSEEEQGKILFEIPNELGIVEQGSIKNNVYFIMYQEDIYLYSRNSYEVKKLNSQFASVCNYKITGALWGIFCNPQNGKAYWYGVQNGQFCICSLEDNTPRLNEFEKINQYDDRFVDATCASSENLYLSKGDVLWRIDQSRRIETVSYFLEQGYIIDTIYDMATVDEEVYILTSVEGEYCLLQAKEEERPQYRQEIILAGEIYGESTLQKLITKFNRRNKEYHITIMNRNEDENVEDFLRRIQLEVSSGNAPDLYSLSEEVMGEYARNGYLQDMGSLLKDTEDFWQAALDTAKIDGIQYGLPYTASLSMAVFSKELTEDREYWTIEEMMEAVEESEAELINDEGSPAGFIMDYALLDKENRDYIDWEHYVSHMTEEPFLRLLEFTKKYCRTERIYSNNPGSTEYKKGIVASMSDLSVVPIFIYLYEDCFNQEASYIGYPRKNNKGIYAQTNNIYMSSTTDKQEGIAAFVDFIYTEGAEISNFTGFTDYLPVQLSAIDRVLQYYKDNKSFFNEKIMEVMKRCIKESLPLETEDNLYAIISEEIMPYLNDQKTVEETAAIIDNRVQLYLNEQKRE